MSLSIHEAAAAIRSKNLTPESLLEQCLERIDRFESKVRAWVVVDREGARRQARQAAAELAAGKERGPLQGIPLGVKDIFDVEGLPTAAGFKPWQNSIARSDATVVARLRQAGAVIMGKTVTTQFASFDPSPTRNPWRLERTPGGSSSGSAAALACGMCLGALASQTGGSITRPAAFCGVAGCKPTRGLVSCAGVVPLAPSMDHVGVMATCVRDLAILLQAIAGSDTRDDASMGAAWPEVYDASQGVTKKPRRFIRLPGMFREAADVEMNSALNAAVDLLTKAGAVVEELALPLNFAEVTGRHHTVMAVQAAEYHEARLRQYLSEYGPCIRSLIEEGERCSAIEYERTLRHRDELLGQMVEMGELEVLLSPATRGPAPGAETTGDPLFNSPWSYLGFPTVCIPIGWSKDGLPLSMQLIATMGQEKALLQAAAWCAQVIQFPERDVAAVIG